MPVGIPAPNNRVHLDPSVPKVVGTTGYTTEILFGGILIFALQGTQ